jgi:hypothetical protein
MHSIAARPGTEITLAATGAVTRAIAAHGAEWAWVNNASRQPDMEGVPLATFLTRLAREQGWSLEYHDADVARQAQAIILHGSVRDLAPHEAVAVAIETSGLRHRLEDGLLVVFSSDTR